MVFSPTDAGSQYAVVDSAQRVEVARRRLPVTQPLSIVFSTSTLSIRILGSREALGRSYSSNVYFQKRYHILRFICADRLRWTGGSVVDASPEVNELVRLTVHLASFLYLVGVRYQRDIPVVTAFRPILLPVEYHDVIGIFPLLRHLLPPLSNKDDGIEQFPSQCDIPFECELTQLTVDSVRSDSVSVRKRANDICQLLHCGLNS